MKWEDYCNVRVPADPIDVDYMLSRASRPVPDDLRRLLTEQQGKTPALGVCPLPGGGATPVGPILISTAAAANRDEPAYTAPYTVEYGLDGLREWSQTQNGLDLLPFASNTSTGWFCLDQREPDQPVVYVWMDVDPGHPGSITPIAPTVTDFLAMLTD